MRDASNLFTLRYFVDPTLWSAEPGNVMYRPTGMLPHALDFQIWQVLTGEGYYAAGWLLTNALLHACVALLVWRLALRLGLSPLASALAGLVTALPILVLHRWLVSRARRCVDTARLYGKKIETALCHG